MAIQSFLQMLGFGGGDAEEAGALEAIVAELDRMEPERARWVAAFAAVLSRVAHADLSMGPEERQAMVRLLGERAHLTEAEARTVVEITHRHSVASGGTEHFLQTREFRALASDEECRDLVDCLFAVAAADGSISAAEENQIRQAASELRIKPRKLAEIRSRWNDYRDVLKA